MSFFSARIVNAVCVLHNIVIQWRLPEPELYDEIDEKFPRINVDAAMENRNEVCRIIDTYF